MRISIQILSCLTLLAAVSARADEGLARITELGDRDLVAQGQKAKTKPKETSYKSVDDDESSSELFKGRQVALSNDLFLGAGLAYFDSFGLTGRYAARIVDKGPIADLTNSLYLEGGLGMTFYGTKRGQTGVTGFSVLAAGRWDFQMDLNWIFFGELGLGINGISNDRKDDVKGGGVFPVIGVGAIGNISNDWAIRGDLSYEFLGVGILHRF